MAKQKKLVIIGGSAAGPSAAARAKRVNPELEVTMFEQGRFISYGSWETPYYIGDVVKDQQKLVVRTPQQFKEMQDIDVKTEHQVTQIDPKEKRIEIVDLARSENQWVSYDKLIIATGARSRRLNLPGSNAKNIFTLKDLQDGLRIRNYIDEKRPKQVAILGGGFIALEMCEAFQLRNIETFVFCRRDLPTGNLEREISETILKELQENGIHFLTHHEPVAFKMNSHEEAISFETNKAEYPVDMVLMALGVIPNVEIAKEAGVEIGKTGAIKTYFDQMTNLTDIYSAGDCCEAFNLVSQDWVHTPLGDIANKQGRVAGENAAGGKASFLGVVGSAAFKVFELEVALTGLGIEAAQRYGFDVDSQIIEAESKVGYMPGAKRILIKLIFDRKNGRLLGAQMTGKEGVARRINTLAVALHQKMTINEISRLDFAYAPPFSAPFDPILIAAEQASRKVKRSWCLFSLHPKKHMAQLQNRIAGFQVRYWTEMVTSILNNSKIRLAEIVTRNKLDDARVSVLVKTLTPKEAIGEPGRRDFPIILGKERIVEAEVLGARAHAFTDSPGEFLGDLKEVLDLPLTSNRERSIYVATLNATLKYLNLIENTIHCKDEDPEKCGKEIASQLLKQWGKVKVGFIGLNPAIAENLTETFGVENVKITDLNKQNVNSLKFGVKIWDGDEMTEELIKQSDAILITGTTFVNGTFDHIMRYVQNYRKKYLIYGVTGAGICNLMGLNRICPYSRNQ